MSIPYLPARVTIPSFVKNDYVVAALIAVSITAITYLVAFSVGWAT